MQCGVREVAERFSFPELFLIIRRDARRRASDLRYAAISRVLAAGSPWNDKVARRANDFIKSLDDSEPVAADKSPGVLVRLFAKAGIPIEEV